MSSSTPTKKESRECERARDVRSAAATKRVPICLKGVLITSHNEEDCVCDSEREKQHEWIQFLFSWTIYVLSQFKIRARSKNLNSSTQQFVSSLNDRDREKGVRDIGRLHANARLGH